MFPRSCARTFHYHRGKLSYRGFSALGGRTRPFGGPSSWEGHIRFGGLVTVRTSPPLLAVTAIRPSDRSSIRSGSINNQEYIS
jgi:hypothetical protein